VFAKDKKLEFSSADALVTVGGLSIALGAFALSFYKQKERGYAALLKTYKKYCAHLETKLSEDKQFPQIIETLLYSDRYRDVRIPSYLNNDLEKQLTYKHLDLENRTLLERSQNELIAASNDFLKKQKELKNQISSFPESIPKKDIPSESYSLKDFQVYVSTLADLIQISVGCYQSFEKLVDKQIKYHLIFVERFSLEDQKEFKALLEEMNRNRKAFMDQKFNAYDTTVKLLCSDFPEICN